MYLVSLIVLLFASLQAETPYYPLIQAVIAECETPIHVLEVGPSDGEVIRLISEDYNAICVGALDEDLSPTPYRGVEFDLVLYLQDKPVAIGDLVQLGERLIVQASPEEAPFLKSKGARLLGSLVIGDKEKQFYLFTKEQRGTSKRPS